jgi:hypothetical protein
MLSDSVTSRELFHRVMKGEIVDRVPLWGDGIREDVRDVWAEQGYARDRDPDQDFGIERREQIQPDVLHRDFRIVDRDCNDDQLDLSADDPRRYPDDWDDQVRMLRDRDFVVGLRVSRGMLQTLGVRAWDSLAPLLCEVADDPDGVARKMVNAADFTIAVLDRALEQIQPDYVLFSEPLASNSGPVVGPWTFKGACAEAYRRILDHVRNRGVRWSILQSYGHFTPLLDEVVAMGMDAYWGGDIDLGKTPYPEIRRRYGKALALIGGIDAGLLEGETGTIQAEMERIVPSLVSGGRYIPLLDGRVRAFVPFENYAAYRRGLVSLVGMNPVEGASAS